MTRHKRVLIANRGEIAVRIARAATSLGLESVGIYSPVDALSLHTRMTTQARETGEPNDPLGAYLDIGRLIDIARETGCDCVHPGYGFLAESAAFAARCENKGITFIGPPSETLALFGNKVRARELAESLGIPIIKGSELPLASADEAAAMAEELGYPVMLKAAAGGGGRGMRIVERAQTMADAFERCRSEAEAAFGDGAIFVEKYLARPRHIEVQILADAAGHVVHLYERDCSVQLRHQKVIEVAPAPGLGSELREKILTDAVRLVKGTSYISAGTVEFLVTPETGEYFFIECNPRIQVEHTITEEVTGVDLMEAQFHIADGESLASLGFPDQQSVPLPQGFALQARVVVQGNGHLVAYKEPSGAAVRVDGCGYLGYAPPPQYDPLLAKLICRSSRLSNEDPHGAFLSAVDRVRHALKEFHIGGVQTNIPLLYDILSLPAFRNGDARTTLLDEEGDALGGSSFGSDTLDLLHQQSLRQGGSPATIAPVATTSSLDIPEGDRVVECPMDSTVVEVNMSVGDTVSAGDTLLVVSAMKMETLVTAPCAGTISVCENLDVGETLSARQAIAAISPGETAEASTAIPESDQTWGPTLEEINTLRRLAEERLAPGSEDPGVVRQRDRGKLTCRERISLLLDEGSFREVGSVAGFATYDDVGDITAFTPANMVGGWGKVEGRMTVVCADDFTSRGGHADGAIAAKSAYLDRLAMEMRVPSVRLLDGSSGGGSVAAMVPEQKKEGESKAQESRGAIQAGRPRVGGGGGSFLPGHLGSSMYAEELATIPVVNLLLGSVVGIGAAKAVLGHFSVMVRDIAQLFVAGPPVVSHAMGYDITKEELGGWHIHCTNGSVDNLAESEEEAMAMTRRFLSYLPPSVHEAPPVLPTNPDDPPDRREEELFTLIPRKRTTTFDIRRAIELMADKGSFFEIGPLWGTDQVAGFVRFNGYPLGVIASDSRHANGGALTADGCDKLKRHLDLCDLFHLPVLNLVDNPGFAVGLEHEITSAIRKGGEWMVAFAQTSVPLFTVIMRRSFGVAGNNYATPRSTPSTRVAWPAADVGGIPPEGGIEAAYKRQLQEAEDPAALRAEIEARIESSRGPTGPLNRFQMEEMIDPRDTRRLVCEWVETAWQIVTQPSRLGPRAIQYRP